MANLKIVEFYSGIGGMRYAVESSNISEKQNIVVLDAIDMNPSANETYLHNFGKSVYNRNIEHISVQDLESYAADMFTLSPPCQPYSRLGNQKGKLDNRAKSFHHLLHLLENITNKPTYILVENVTGFINSESRNDLKNTLQKTGYNFQEFSLSPSNFSIPNSRTRYYLLASQKKLLIETNQNQIFTSIPNESSLQECEPLCNYLEIIEDEEYLKQNLVPEKIVKSHGQLFDIVQSTDNHSCCFTKGYRHFIEGAGSVLQTVDGERGEDLLPLKLRYFTKKEISNLQGFPDEFSFPKNFTEKQCARL